MCQRLYSNANDDGKWVKRYGSRFVVLRKQLRFVIGRDAGVNFYDTAELYPVAFNYGKTTEVWMGNWMEKRIAEGKFERSKIYIATKVNPMGIGCPVDERAGKPHSYDKEIVFASCRGSLERLKTDYIDLYQFHWPSRDTPIFGASCVPVLPLFISHIQLSPNSSVSRIPRARLEQTM